MRLMVRSRRGNLVLASLGFVYTVSATAVLAWFVIDVWRAAVAIDRLMQMALIIAGACGIWFVVTAMENLGLRHHHRQWHVNR
jgi:cell division protein FtsW (lipid II flippase)